MSDRRILHICHDNRRISPGEKDYWDAIGRGERIIPPIPCYDCGLTWEHHEDCITEFVRHTVWNIPPNEAESISLAANSGNQRRKKTNMTDLTFQVFNVDPELQALEIISLALSGLEPNQAKRVLGYAVDRWGLDDSLGEW